MRVEVIRSFMSNGAPVKVGTVLDVEEGAGRGLVASGKAERISAEVAPSGPMTTENTEGLVTGKRRKTSGE